MLTTWVKFMQSSFNYELKQDFHSNVRVTKLGIEELEKCNTNNMHN